jgi:hypothetical protein
LGLPILCHNFQIQKLEETCCGEYCITFLLLMSRSKSKHFKFEDVVLFLLK